MPGMGLERKRPKGARSEPARAKSEWPASGVGWPGLCPGRTTGLTERLDQLAPPRLRVAIDLARHAQELARIARFDDKPPEQPVPEREDRAEVAMCSFRNVVQLMNAGCYE